MISASKIIRKLKLLSIFIWIYIKWLSIDSLATNVRVYDQLRLHSADISSYDDVGNWVTDVSVLYFVSDAQTLNQAIGYTRCCKLWAVEQTFDPFFNETLSGKHPIFDDIGKISSKSACFGESR